MVHGNIYKVLLTDMMVISVMVMTINMMMMTMMTLEELGSTKRKSQLVQSSMAKQPSRSIYDNDGDGDSMKVKRLGQFTCMPLQ